MKKYTFLVPKILPIVLITLLIVFLFGSTLFPPQGKMLYGGDVYDAYYYWKNYLAESIHAGIIPFWNPYNFSGTPFLAHPNINIFYPFTWIFILFPLNQSFSVYFFIHLIIAGVSMYWLGREYSDRVGALAGALTYALGGYFAARVYSGHLEYVDTAAWMPLAFGLSRRAILQPNVKNTIWMSIGLSILLLSGNELFFLFTLELIGLYVLYTLWQKRKEKGRILNFLRIAKVFIFALLLAVGLTAVEVLPRLQFIRLSLRSIGVPYGLAGSGSFPIPSFRLFVQPLFYGGPDSYRGLWPNLSEYTYYVGLIPIILSVTFIILTICSIIVRSVMPNLFRHLKKILKRVQDDNIIHSDFWFFIFIAVPFFILISLGTNIHPNIHELLWRFTPFYRSLRFPMRHLFMVAFSASIVTAIVVGAIKNKILKIIILVVIIVDLFSFDKRFYHITDVPTATFDQKLITTLQNDKSIYRVLPDHTVISSVRRDMDLGASSMYKISSTSDYNSMILSPYYHFIDVLNKSPISSILQFNVEIPPPNPYSSLVDFLNVKYILSDKTADAIGNDIPGKFKQILEGDRYRLYENLTFYPRFFLVGKMNTYSSEHTLEQDLMGSIDLSKTVLLQKIDIKNAGNILLDCGENTPGWVNVLSYTPNKILLRTQGMCNSFLSASEVFYPGWSATIDGKETPVYKSNVAFRAIYMPKGSHSVVFYYNPEIFYLGGIITLVSLGAFMLLLRMSYAK